MKIVSLTFALSISLSAIYSQSRGGISNVSSNININQTLSNTNLNFNQSQNSNIVQRAARGNVSVQNNSRNVILNVRQQSLNVNKSNERNIMQTAVDDNVQSNAFTNRNVVASRNVANVSNVVLETNETEVVLDNNPIDLQIEQTQVSNPQVNISQINTPSINLNVNIPKPEITLNLKASSKIEEKVINDKVEIKSSLEKVSSDKMVSTKVKSNNYKQKKGNYHYQQSVGFSLKLKNKVNILTKKAGRKKTKKIKTIVVCYTF